MIKGKTQLNKNYARWKGYSRYRIEGKIEQAMSDEEFENGLENGKFVQEKNKGFGVLLWLTELRLSEGLELKKEQFRIDKETLYIDTGMRKKKRLFKKDGTPRQLKAPEPLPIPLNAPHIQYLLDAIEDTPKGERVFP